MMRVEYAKRIDDKTIACVVRWEAPGNKSMRMVVPVKATFDEVPEPPPLREPIQNWEFQDAPKLSNEFRLKAVWAAQEMARSFSEIAVELPNATRS